MIAPAEYQVSITDSKNKSYACSQMERMDAICFMALVDLRALLECPGHEQRNNRLQTTKFVPRYHAAKSASAKAKSIRLGRE